VSIANRFYELSLEAEHDIEDIFSYMREEIRTGLRSFVHGNHIIFYRIFTSRIRIVRILHARQDIQQNLDI